MATETLRSSVATPVRASEVLSACGGSVAPSSIRFPTGLQPLDDVLGGGVCPQDLVLVTGRPGVGKTILALQWARWLAKQGVAAIYVCYEHSPRTLVDRLAALELAAGGGDALGEARQAGGFDKVAEYAERLTFVQGSGRHTDVEAIDQLASQSDGPTVVFVDYLQKVPVRSARLGDDERAGLVAESLKDIAINQNVGVVAIASADNAALRARRVRLYHLRGSSALAHEADVALVLNDKAVAVSKNHLAFDPVRAELFRHQLVVSIEKHRNGPSDLDVEFAKDYAHYRLDPHGRFIAEKLVDDVLYTE